MKQRFLRSLGIIILSLRESRAVRPAEGNSLREEFALVFWKETPPGRCASDLPTGR
jgi:hypothetical protein